MNKKILNSSNSKNNFNYKYILFLPLLILCFLVINNFNSSNKIYAINKPTYTDMIKNKYKDTITDEKAEALALEESTLKEAYSKGLGKEVEVSSNKSFYGKYPNGYTGAVNYRRENFLLTAYSLRDLKKDNGFQPLISGKTKTLNFDHNGFNEISWDRYGMTSTNTIKWILYQFEVKKLLRVYENVDYLILSNIYNESYEKIIEEKDNINEVVSLVGQNGLENLSSGDILVSYNEKNNKVNYVGIYLGQDENKNYYSLSPNKLVYNSKDYALNTWALSYINSTDVYPQDIDGKINLVSGTKYNYGIKLKFLK